MALRSMVFLRGTLDPMRFLCDEMLAGLVPWLRAAGHDTLAAEPGQADRRLLDRATADGRFLLTRDRRFMDMRGAEGTVVLLYEDGIEAWAREVSSRLEVDWLYRPFSRCMLCNTRLEALEQVDPAALPDGGRHCRGPFTRCPDCGRVYWQGGHVSRIRARLEGFERQKNRPA